MRSVLLTTATAFSLAFLPAALAQGDETFAKANQDFADGKFKEATAAYEELVRAKQWSASLFYDLGNCYFRTADFGRAILNYERALALEPNHPEAQANLRIARDRARALELQQGWAERLLSFANLNQYSIAAAATFWLGLFGLIWLFLARRSAMVFLFSLFSLGVCAGLVYAVFSIGHGNKGAALAIVTGNAVNARVATADSAGTVLALPAGSEVRILSERGDWTYAALPNNLRGWIPAKAVETVRL